MSIIVADCPHCGAQSVTFDVFGYTVTQRLTDNVPFALTAAACRHCGLPLVSKWVSPSLLDPVSALTLRVGNVLKLNKDFTDADVVLAEYWPPAPEPQIPASLPREVERALIQAERNFVISGSEEAAAIMYRRALELGLKSAYPTLKGGLIDRIRKLVTENHLPSTLGDWLTQVRLIGNDGAHEIDDLERDELVAARDFVDMALRYIFTLPAQVAARRGLPPEVA